MKLNSRTGRLFFALSVVVAISMNVLMWVQFDDIAQAFKTFFSVATLAVIASNARLAFPRNNL